ncbi:hypothetical protein DACRYDRAFT_20985 [Dacryopinax primogenitus]|uniref:DUF1746 domain-containing protein n=1 Tax=Dacryopinax primogenitus (strain DJM 731) TaxID=1858805 RepID=M5G2L0_DACPD|nr:uncharacterized protein DACRYDRAFT_20985 [Dacryopinax primogenitus]EJU04461.1 hypothetical protein DACRYDRAFT_20985 [Dacryopinax primogenitus]
MSLLLFISRSFFHLHCVNLREWHPGRSLRFFVGLLIFNFGHALLRHSWGKLSKTFILDFVGHSSRASRFHFLLLDLLILVLQVITVYLTWETGHRDLQVPDPLESSEFVEDAEDFLDLEAAEIPKIKHPALRPVFTLRYRHCWQRLWEPHNNTFVVTSGSNAETT